jgi:hypothetical protein
MMFSVLTTKLQGQPNSGLIWIADRCIMPRPTERLSWIWLAAASTASRALNPMSYVCWKLPAQGIASLIINSDVPRSGRY